MADPEESERSRRSETDAPAPADRENPVPPVPPLVNIKDEPVDEGYDCALLPHSPITMIKEELEYQEDELRITSVYSIAGDSYVPAPAPQTPSILGDGRSLSILGDGRSLAPVRCSGCSKVLLKGQTAFHRRSSSQLFCSAVCLPDFLPNAVLDQTCHQCLKRNMKNKAVQCKPSSRCQETLCDLLPSQTTDTDCPSNTIIEEEVEVEIKVKVVVLPVPVPVFIPVPMNMYSQYTPVPMMMPVPVPVPMVLHPTLSDLESRDKKAQPPPSGAANPSSVRCSGCSKGLSEGQTAYRRKGSTQLFCSAGCLPVSDVPTAELCDAPTPAPPPTLRRRSLAGRKRRGDDAPPSKQSNKRSRSGGASLSAAPPVVPQTSQDPQTQENSGAGADEAAISSSPTPLNSQSEAERDFPSSSTQGDVEDSPSRGALTNPGIPDTEGAPPSSLLQVTVFN